MRWELWELREGDGNVLTFVPDEEGKEQALADVPGATLVWSVEADSWNEAHGLWYAYMDWGPYIPLESDDDS